MNISRYLLWRTMMRAGGTAAMGPQAQRELEAQVTRERHIIRRALASAEASAMVADPEVVDAAFADFARRCGDGETFLAALARNGLDDTRLKEAIAAELRAGLVLERIGAVTVPEETVRSFYDRRRRDFVIPERRSARHILVTINAGQEENSRENAGRRIREAQEQLAAGDAFVDLALRISECPSALDGGRLGEIRRGQLYPELDHALFTMGAGEMRVVESPLGLHLLLCDALIPPQPLDYETAAPSIRRRLEQLARDRALRAWLKEGEEGTAIPTPP